MLNHVVTVVAVLFCLGVLSLIIKTILRQYKAVAPNEVLVKYGKGIGKEGFTLITGGSAFVMPVIQKAKTLALDAFQVPVAVKNVPSEEGVLVTVEAIASLKIGTDQSLLAAAVRRFLNSDLAEIKCFAQQPLEACLRGVVATMTVEELVKNRTTFGSKVQEQVGSELCKLGLIVDNFLIQEITDGKGYIEALGVKRTAEVKRDAAIAQANANRDQTIRCAEAEREANEKAAEAKRIGETAKAAASQAISDAEKARDVQIASNLAEVKAKQVQVEIAAKIAAANRDKELRISQVAAEQAETEARTKLQEKEKERHDAELQASLIVAANREKEANIIKAESARRATVIAAEGQREAIELQASAAKVKAEREADGARAAAEHAATGRKAQAAAQQAELEAAACGRKAQLEAEADGNRARLLAEAEGQKAALLAVAAGVAEKAKAYQLLDSTGQLLEIIKASPDLVEAIGKAVKTIGEGTFVPMAQAIGTGLGNIDEIRIVDMGGSKEGQDPATKFVNMAQNALWSTLQTNSAMPGTAAAISGLLKKVGIDLNAILSANKTGSQHCVTPVDTANIVDCDAKSTSKPSLTKV